MNPIFENILWGAAGLISGGMIIIFISKARKKHETTPKSSRGSYVNTTPSPSLTNETPGAKKQSAKESFLNNITRFGDILPQLNTSLNIESWTEIIVDINNHQLTELWQRCLKNVSVWKQILSSWGLRQDTCKSFTYLEKYGNMYETVDGIIPEVGHKYNVIDGCWILTDEKTGNKHVIKKGLIQKL